MFAITPSSYCISINLIWLYRTAFVDDTIGIMVHSLRLDHKYQFIGNGIVQFLLRIIFTYGCCYCRNIILKIHLFVMRIEVVIVYTILSIIYISFGSMLIFGSVSFLSFYYNISHIQYFHIVCISVIALD